MKRVTYILGAGASYLSMPLLADMKTRMKIYSDFIFQLKSEDKIKHEAVNVYLNDLNELIRNIDQSTSIDNYAKELFNSNEKEKLNKLKLILSGYFLFEQVEKEQYSFRRFENQNQMEFDRNTTYYNNEIVRSIKLTFDGRYRTFLNHFFSQSTKQLPPEINIVSWNYDLQIEGTFCRANNYCSLELAQTDLNISPSKAFKKNSEASHIIKLNGTAGVYSEGSLESQKFGNLITGFKDDILSVIKNNINLIYNYSVKPSVTFAFEHNDETNENQKIAKELIKFSDIVIIIGYSFPTMNNNTDRHIFSEARNAERLFLQIPKKDFARIKRNIARVNETVADKVQLIDDLDEFYIY